jgi:acetyltransferase
MTTSPDLVERLLHPLSVAIVGASPTSYVGRVLCENLRALAYSGQVFPVNPRYEEVLGWPCLASLDQAPDGLDAVVAAVRIDHVPDVLRAAAKRGARAVVVPGGGFTETGDSALRIHEEIAAIGREFDMAVCGPNCMGVIAPGRGSALYIGTIPPTLIPGNVALVSQSGSVVEAAVNMGPRVGFSVLISYGNEAVTTVGDYLRWLARDDETHAATLFLEGFRDPVGFVEGARALRAAGKPLAVLKAGRDQEAAAAIAAHSGSLAGSEEVVRGLLHQLGAIGVDDLDELFEVAELLGHGKLPSGRRLFVVTDSGGEANLVADHARALGLELPPPSATFVGRMQARWPHFSYVGNPIDPWGVDADYQSLYAEILDAATDESVDVVAVALDKVTPWAGENEVHLGVAAADALIKATGATDVTNHGGKVPVFLTVHATGSAAGAVRDPLRSAGVPLLHGLRPALVAIRRAWWWRAWKPRTALPRRAPVPISYDEEGPILSEWSSRKVAAQYGVPLVPAERAATQEEALRTGRRLGYPVVMKADVAGVAHKAAAGLVRTGIASAEAAAQAFAQLMDRASSDGLHPAGVLVEATTVGIELICGMRRDPVFGPVVLVGLGGTLTEVFREVAVRVCPLSPEDLEEMPNECAVGRLLRASGVDPAPVLAVLRALDHIALDHPEIQEVDLNPVFVGTEGAVAADALVVLLGGARAEGSDR